MYSQGSMQLGPARLPETSLISGVQRKWKVGCTRHVEKLIAGERRVIVDLDGILIRGGRPTQGAKAFLESDARVAAVTTFP
jgi:hypothetical protein